MLRRILTFGLAVPVAIVLVTLAVTNRHDVRLVLDPFRPEDPVLFVVLPFYGYLLGALVAGVAIGGVATWIAQSRWRRSARRRAAEAERWHSEADRLNRERERLIDPSRQLAPVNR